MELGVRVNAGSDREVDDEPREGMEWPSVNVHSLPHAYVMPNSEALSADSIDQPEPNRSVSNRTLASDLGPCLYLGPAGQRCNRRATRDGFCSRHQPDAPTASTPFFTPKKLAAFLIALAMLWPEITRFLSALARLLR
jgi:Family of unknown function (DUF5763)